MGAESFDIKTAEEQNPGASQIQFVRKIIDAGTF